MYLKQFRTGFQKSISSQNPVIYKGIKKNARNYKVYGNSTQSILPVEYQQVEYLEGTGDQYINTGYAPTDATEIEIKFSPTSLWTNSTRYICGADSVFNNGMSVSIISDNTKYGMARGVFGKIPREIAYTTNLYTINTIKSTKEKLVYNGVEKVQLGGNYSNT